MLAGLPQMCADALTSAPQQAVNIVFEGPAATSYTLAPGGSSTNGVWTIDDGAAADTPTITTTAHNFISWATQRADWRDSCTGDIGHADAAAVLGRNQRYLDGWLPARTAQEDTFMNIDLLSVSSYAGSQPHEQFDWLRENARVFRHDESDGPGFWVLTRYDDVKEVGRDHERFSSSPTIMIDDPTGSSLTADRTNDADG